MTADGSGLLSLSVALILRMIMMIFLLGLKDSSPQYRKDN